MGTKQKCITRPSGPRKLILFTKLYSIPNNKGFRPLAPIESVQRIGSFKGQSTHLIVPVHTVSLEREFNPKDRLTCKFSVFITGTEDTYNALVVSSLSWVRLLGPSQKACLGATPDEETATIILNAIKEIGALYEVTSVYINKAHMPFRVLRDADFKSIIGCKTQMCFSTVDVAEGFAEISMALNQQIGNA